MIIYGNIAGNVYFGNEFTNLLLAIFLYFDHSDFSRLLIFVSEGLFETHKKLQFCLGLTIG